MNLEMTTGLFVLILAIAVSAALVLLVLRFARRTDSLIEAMALSAFVPEKRRRYLTLMSVEGSLFLLSALVWSVTTVGAIPSSIGNPVLAALLVVGMASILGLTIVGLRPTQLTEANREDLRRAAPQILGSLFLAPYAQIEDLADLAAATDPAPRRRRRQRPG
jgi:hypothetical protein